MNVWILWYKEYYEAPSLICIFDDEPGHDDLDKILENEEITIGSKEILELLNNETVRIDDKSYYHLEKMELTETKK